MTIGLGVEFLGVHVNEGKFIEIEHTEGDNMVLIPCGCGFEGIRKCKGRGVDGIWMAIPNSFWPLVTRISGLDKFAVGKM